MTQSDVIIVGGGAAGLSAALILGRARRNVIVCDDGRPRNATAENMHGFVSRDGTPPAKFLELARDDLKPYPSVDIVNTKVDQVELTADGFVATCDGGDRFLGRRLLLANGVRDKLPDIEGIAELWGRSVFVCPFCDGWEMRDRTIAAYGEGKDVVEFAQELYGWTHRLIVCVENKQEITAQQHRWLEVTQCRLVEGRVRKLVVKSGSLEGLELDQDEHVHCDGLFLSASLRQTWPIAEMLGCKINKTNSIVVDEKSQTSVHGCYAAGDAVTHLHQVIIAAASGVEAAVSIVADVLTEEADALASAGTTHAP